MGDSLEDARQRLAGRAVPVKVIGRGATAVVVEAIASSGERVAIKLLDRARLDDPEQRARFEREARTTSSIAHPAVLRILDVDAEAGLMFMELIDGESLAERLAKHGKMSVAEVRWIARQMLGALEEAHRRGIFHRDIKPSNILLGREGADRVVKLGDFGIARTESSRLTETGSSLGTPAYAAPEQLRGHADARSDVYALGATLFEAASGEPLHTEGRWIADRRAHLFAATGDASLAAALARAVEERPEDRFDGATSFLAALDQAALVPERRPKPRTRVAFVWPLLISAALLAAWVAVRSGHDRATPARASVDDALRRGREAIEDDRLADAQRELGRAFDAAPNDPHVHYALAFSSWWGNREDSEVLFHIERAKALGLPLADARFLDGIAMMRAHDPNVISHFEAAATSSPAHVDLAYGLFEAYFHHGRCDDAVRSFRSLVRARPSWRLGSLHIASIAIEQKDADLFGWIAKHARFESDPAQASWPVRWALAREDYAGARAEIAKSTSRGASRDGSLVQLSIIERALSGDLAGAEALVRAGTDRPLEDGLAAYGLRVARGLPAAEARDALDRAIAATVSSGDTLENNLRLGLIEGALGHPGAVDRVRARAAASHKSSDPRVTLVELVIAAMSGAPLPAASEHGGPEVDAFVAAWSSDDPGLLDRWDALFCDGRWRLSARYLAALRARARGDRARTVEACREVIAPRIFRWEWSALVGPCLLWSAEAQLALGDRTVAVASAERLRALRAEAGSGDPLLLELGKLPW